TYPDEDLPGPRFGPWQVDLPQYVGAAQVLLADRTHGLHGLFCFVTRHGPSVSALGALLSHRRTVRRKGKGGRSCLRICVRRQPWSKSLPICSTAPAASPARASEVPNGRLSRARPSSSSHDARSARVASRETTKARARATKDTAVMMFVNGTRPASGGSEQT